MPKRLRVECDSSRVASFGTLNIDFTSKLHPRNGVVPVETDNSRSGWAKKFAYISSRDLFSKIKMQISLVMELHCRKTGKDSEKANKDDPGTKTEPYDERLKELIMFSLEQRRLRDDMIACIKYFTRKEARISSRSSQHARHRLTTILAEHQEESPGS
ncbi:40S ribosomal protein S3a [Varanus komodoensis]|nr:40S ribosomal protein S3a [Varanus komodoensis]